MILTPDRYVASLRSDAAALAMAARDHLDAPVPWCGDWTMADLVGHVGMVHQQVREQVRRHATERISRRDMEKPPANGVVEWFAEGSARLADNLEAAGPDSDVWNWAGAPHTAAFWFRRMAQETLVHRWDAERAAGVESPVLDPELAADGIDEFTEWFLPLVYGRGPVEGLTGSVHFHATDGEGEWWVGLSPEGAEVRREHAKGDVAVRGPAADLLLLVWNRGGTEGLEVFGDDAVLERWRTDVRI